MKSARFKKSYRKSASALHRQVGDILRDINGPFACHRIYQEYPVQKVNPSFFSGAYKFDWANLDLKLIIECHGAQHYTPTDFGGRGTKQAQENFAFIQASDLSKKDAAIAAGWTYIVVPYWDQKIVSSDYLWNKYLDHFNNNQPKTPSKKTETEYALKVKIKAQQYRKQRYLKAKEIKNKQKEASHDRHTRNDS